MEDSRQQERIEGLKKDLTETKLDRDKFMVGLRSKTRKEQFRQKRMKAMEDSSSGDVVDWTLLSKIDSNLSDNGSKGLPLLCVGHLAKDTYDQDTYLMLMRCLRKELRGRPSRTIEDIVADILAQKPDFYSVLAKYFGAANNEL